MRGLSKGFSLIYPCQKIKNRINIMRIICLAGGIIFPNPRHNRIPAKIKENFEAKKPSFRMSAHVVYYTSASAKLSYRLQAHRHSSRLRVRACRSL